MYWQIMLMCLILYLFCFMIYLVTSNGLALVITTLYISKLVIVKNSLDRTRQLIKSFIKTSITTDKIMFPGIIGFRN